MITHNPAPVRVLQFWTRSFRDGDWLNEPWYQAHFADGTVQALDTCPAEWADRIVNEGRTSPSPEQQIIDQLSRTAGRKALVKALSTAAHYRSMASGHVPGNDTRNRCIRCARTAIAYARGLRLTGQLREAA